MTSASRAAGNVFAYVLIAVVLFAGLSFALSRSNDSAPQNDITAAQTQAAVSEILGYAAQAQSAIDQMVMNGTGIDEIDFITPGELNFNTAPNINKLFHPDGGGLQYRTLSANAKGTDFATAPNNYYIGKYSNVVWTPTTSQDVIFSAYGIKNSVCRELNRKVSGSTVPAVAGAAITSLFVPGSVFGGTNFDLSVSRCALCENRSAACVQFNTDTDKNVFYSVLVAR